MPTNPTPAAKRAANSIEMNVIAEATGDAYMMPNRVERLAKIIDLAFADERAAGEAMARTLVTCTKMLPSWKNEISASVAAWRKARGL